MEAQLNLAVMLRIGDGITQDKAEAYKWYLKAAQQGDAEAQFNLAIMLGRGDGVTENRGQADQWLQKSAAQGFEPAKKLLGRFQDK